MNVSLYKSFTDFAPRVYQLEKIIDQIRGDGIKAAIDRIREAVDAGNDSLVDALKRQLPHFTVSGVFNGRRKLTSTSSPVTTLPQGGDTRCSSEHRRRHT